MPRLALPQNYVKKSGTLFEDFETIGDWHDATGALGGDGVYEADTVNFKTGTQSLKITPSAAGGSMAVYKDITPTIFRNTDKNFTVDIYIPDPTAFSWIKVYLATSSGIGKAMLFTWQPGSDNIHKGWNRLFIYPSTWASLGGGSWNDTDTVLVIRFALATEKTGSISVDNICFGQHTVPKLLFTFDDGYQSAYDNGITYMITKGLNGTAYPNLNLVGTAGRIGTTELDTLYAAGWAIGNHTIDHTDLSTLETADAITDKVQPQTTWATAQGYLRGIDSMALPSNGYNDLVLSTLATLGFNTIRWGAAGHNYSPYEDGFLKSTTLNNAITLATAISHIDTARKYGSTYVFYIHKIDAAASSDTWTTADFQALVDYAIASGIDIVTIDEWYEGLTNPRYKSLSLNRA